jgi:hypothetical protein
VGESWDSAGGPGPGVPLLRVRSVCPACGDGCPPAAALPAAQAIKHLLLYVEAGELYRTALGLYDPALAYLVVVHDTVCMCGGTRGAEGRASGAVDWVTTRAGPSCGAPPWSATWGNGEGGRARVCAWLWRRRREDGGEARPRSWRDRPFPLRPRSGTRAKRWRSYSASRLSRSPSCRWAGSVRLMRLPHTAPGSLPHPLPASPRSLLARSTPAPVPPARPAPRSAPPSTCTCAATPLRCATWWPRGQSTSRRCVGRGWAEPLPARERTETRPLLRAARGRLLRGPLCGDPAESAARADAAPRMFRLPDRAGAAAGPRARPAAAAAGAAGGRARAPAARAHGVRRAAGDEQAVRRGVSP